MYLNTLRTQGCGDLSLLSIYPPAKVWLQTKHLFPMDSWCRYLVLCVSHLWPHSSLSSSAQQPWLGCNPEVYKCLPNACSLPLPQATQQTSLQPVDCKNTVASKMWRSLGEKPHLYKSDLSHILFIHSRVCESALLYIYIYTFIYLLLYIYSSHVYPESKSEFWLLVRRRCIQNWDRMIPGNTSEKMKSWDWFHQSFGPKQGPKLPDMGKTVSCFT